MLQLVWLLFAYIGVALFFALDMVHVAAVLGSLWVCYVFGAWSIYARWYELSAMSNYIRTSHQQSQ
eukprot:scaffold22755_cov59-Phaeocystis_antarctica.AAC.4